MYYHICSSFLIAYRSPEYIWITVVLAEFLLVIQSQQTLSGHILCAARFALGPKKPERTKARSLIFRTLPVHKVRQMYMWLTEICNIKGLQVA